MATSKTAKLVVGSEKRAFELLEQALRGELDTTTHELKFDWPILEIRLKGEGYDSAITSDLAEAVIEVQRSLNRAYARTIHGTSNARTLTDLERKNIQFKAKVSKGSSLIEINMGEFATTLIKSVSAMDPTTVAVTVLGLATIYGGSTMYKAFLKAKSDDKQIEQTERTKIAMSEQETRRLQVFAEAVTRVPQLGHAAQDFDVARNEILRAGRDADTLSVNSVEIDGQTARVIASARRAESDEVQLNGNYLVLTVDLRQADEVKLRVRSCDNGREFIASFHDSTLDQSQVQLLQKAEWSRSPVYLSINGRVLRGEVTVATVVRAQAQPTSAR